MIDFLGRLLCPECGEINLHHEAVMVWERPVEDGVSIKTVLMAGKTIRKQKADNPSPRRDGIRIYFWCEHCDIVRIRPKFLIIYQHKGETFVEWEGKTATETPKKRSDSTKIGKNVKKPPKIKKQASKTKSNTMTRGRA